MSISFFIQVVINGLYSTDCNMQQMFDCPIRVRLLNTSVSFELFRIRKLENYILENRFICDSFHKSGCTLSKHNNGLYSSLNLKTRFLVPHGKT